jgi:hypothetical protein
VKRSRTFSSLALPAILLLTLAVSPSARAAAAAHTYWANVYSFFQDVLDPLQDEAIPRGDVQRIRSMANELVTRGQAIVNLDVPEDVSNPYQRKFAEARRKFFRALSALALAANSRAGTDAEVKKSFAAVHDSFERLAELAPRVYPPVAFPVISINCPRGEPAAGSQITLAALVPEDVDFVFRWTVDAGKILDDQGTAKITLDTTGLGGRTILVTVEASDGIGHVVVATCQIQISVAD